MESKFSASSLRQGYAAREHFPACWRMRHLADQKTKEQESASVSPQRQVSGT